jgi:hypothetical protein
MNGRAKFPIFLIKKPVPADHSVGLDPITYRGRDGVGICYIHDDESLAASRRLHEIIGDTSAASKRDDWEVGPKVALHLR